MIRLLKVGHQIECHLIDKIITGLIIKIAFKCLIHPLTFSKSIVSSLNISCLPLPTSMPWIILVKFDLKFISQKYITRWISRHDSNDDWRFPIRKFCDFHRNFSFHSSVNHDTLEQFSVRTHKRHLKINIMKKNEK